MSVTTLYQAKSGPVTTADVTAAIRACGISSGDLCLVHSDITTLGRLAIFDKHALLDGLCDAIQTAVDSTGTILMPTFSYTACNDGLFDIEKTPSTVGVLTEHFRRRSGTVRSDHPIFSFAGRGPNSASILTCGPDSFGAGSVFAHLEDHDGWLVFFGVPLTAMTFIHRIEQLFGSDYRFLKTFRARVLRDGQESLRENITFFCRHLDREVITDFTRIEAALSTTGALRRVPLGDSHVLAVRAKSALATGLDLLKSDPYSLLAHPPIQVSV